MRHSRPKPMMRSGSCIRQESSVDPRNTTQRPYGRAARTCNADMPTCKCGSNPSAMSMHKRSYVECKYARMVVVYPSITRMIHTVVYIVRYLASYHFSTCILVYELYSSSTEYSILVLLLVPVRVSVHRPPSLRRHILVQCTL